MARGGARENAGRKGTWTSGQTKAVKLPEALLDEVLRYARHLDAGGKQFDSVTESTTPKRNKRERELELMIEDAAGNLRWGISAIESQRIPDKTKAARTYEMRAALEKLGKPWTNPD